MIALLGLASDATGDIQTADPAKFMGVEVVEVLKQDIAALKTTQVGDEVDALVKDGLADGRCDKTGDAQSPFSRPSGITT